MEGGHDGMNSGYMTEKEAAITNDVLAIGGTGLAFAQAYSNLMGNRIAIGDIEGARDYGEKAVVVGNYLTDKGLLCAIYHKLGLYEKRDTLYKELKELKYENLNSLEQIFFD